MRPDCIYHEVEQGSEAWRLLRLGKVTGTTAAELLVNGKSADGLGVSAQTLIYQLSADLITGELPPDFSNYWTDRGRELESQARAAYEEETFEQTNVVGFVSWGAFAGYSPDFGYRDILGEIKCLSAREHIRFAATREIPKDHRAQMEWGMFITGAAACDYVAYHPEAKKWRLIIERVYPDPDTQSKFAERLPMIEARVRAIVEAAGVEVDTLQGLL